MLSKKSFSYIALRALIFILLPFSLSILMFVRIGEALIGIMEDEAAENAVYQSELISRQIDKQLEYMTIISEYFSDRRVPEENMETTLSYLVEPSQMPKSGILRLDETAVCGRDLHAVTHEAVRRSFRGTKAVMYCEGEGLLFTVPVYNKKNIRYVFYQFFEPSELLGSTVVDCYDGRAQFAIADSISQSAMEFYGDGNMDFLFDDGFQSVVLELDKRLGLKRSSSMYNKRDGEREICFVSITDCGNLYLIGRVPYEAMSSGAEKLFFMVIAVSVFMLILLMIGTMNMVIINEKARESEELREAKAAAEEANKAKGEFIASMSHELRTPINVILGMNEMILREEANPVTKEHAIDIKSAAQILLSLINDILDYTKIETGRMNIICAEYSTVNAIKDLTLLTESRAHQKSIEFILDIDPNIPIGLYGDDIRIKQVLTNLLTNAVKYTAEGVVTLKIKEVSREDDEITLRFEVKDTGIGIKKEDLENLLTPFLRIDEEKNRNVEGTGLGMPIISNLLRLMNSTLDVESVYGKGSVFGFEIKQKIVDATPVGDINKRLGDMSKEYSYKVSFIAPDAKVLVVDDNTMNRQIFKSLLLKTKINISEASSGMKCLELVKKEHFDIIFMDYLMPEMNGVETLNELKKLEGNLCKDSPVVALTANAFRGDREKYMSYGFDDFLAKPIVAEKLEELIMNMLPKEYVSTRTEDIEETAAAEVELPEIDGVNMGIAKMYMKENFLVMDAIANYYDRLKESIKELPALYEEIGTDEGLANYKISVHAMKSTSAMVGVMTASEIARVLEYASRDGDRERVHALHPILMEEIHRMYERLEPYKRKREHSEGESFGDMGELSEKLSALRSAMDEMDFDAVEDIMKGIKEAAYPDELQDIIDSIGEDVSFSDFESAEEKLENAEEYIRNNCNLTNRIQKL